MNQSAIISELLSIKANSLETVKRVDAVLKKMDPPKKKSGLTEEERLRIRNGFAKSKIRKSL